MRNFMIGASNAYHIYHSGASTARRTSFSAQQIYLRWLCCLLIASLSIEPTLTQSCEDWTTNAACHAEEFSMHSKVLKFLLVEHLGAIQRVPLAAADVTNACYQPKLHVVVCATPTDTTWRDATPSAFHLSELLSLWGMKAEGYAAVT
jgi:hypothetical protein